MKWLLTLVLPIAIMLSSCANEYDVMMVEKQMEAEIKIAEAKARATEAQSDALALTITENMSDLERFFAREQIASLEVTPSGLKSVTTGNDVLITIAADGRFIVRDIVTGTVLYRSVVGLADALKNSGNTDVRIDGEGNSVEVAQSEVKQVVVGENNVATSTQSSSGGSASGVDEEVAGVSEAEWTECTTSPSKEVTLGEAASCFSQEGYDVEIKGGLAYLDGEEWTELNEWEASK